jgi:hypothetical protein
MSWLSWPIYLLPVGQRRYQLCQRLQVPFPELVVRGNVRRRLRRFGIDPNFDRPQRWVEKIDAYKRGRRDPRMVRMADKVEVQGYLREMGMEHLLVERYAVADRFDDLDFDALPDAFVLKVNHDSGGVFVVRDKSTCDTSALGQQIDERLAYPFIRGVRLGEWNYLHIRPKVLAEAYLEDDSGQLRDFKVYCFRGEPAAIQVDFDRFGDHTRAFYDTDWQRLDMVLGYPPSLHDIPPPKQLAEMLEVSRQLGRPFPFIRIDFYCVGARLYFGEFTFWPWSGTQPHQPDAWEFELGRRLDLSDWGR